MPLPTPCNGFHFKLIESTSLYERFQLHVMDSGRLRGIDVSDMAGFQLHVMDSMTTLKLLLESSTPSFNSM